MAKPEVLITVYELNEILDYHGSLSMFLHSMDPDLPVEADVELLRVSLASRVDPKYLRAHSRDLPLEGG